MSEDQKAMSPIELANAVIEGICDLDPLDLASEWAEEVERSRARLAAAEKVCEVAQYFVARHPLIHSDDISMLFAKALAEWERCKS